MQVVDNGFASVGQPGGALAVPAQSIKQPIESPEQDAADDWIDNAGASKADEPVIADSARQRGFAGE
jgi:hypothetical protein